MLLPSMDMHVDGFTIIIYIFVRWYIIQRYKINSCGIGTTHTFNVYMKQDQ